MTVPVWRETDGGLFVDVEKCKTDGENWKAVVGLATYFGTVVFYHLTPCIIIFFQRSTYFVHLYETGSNPYWADKIVL